MSVPVSGKPSQNDGLSVDENGVLYITEISQNRVTRWQPPQEQSENAFQGNEKYTVLAEVTF